MKTQFIQGIMALALLSTLNAQLSTAHAQGTAFTYQGRLQNNGSPANGNYDLTFALFNASSGGSAVAGPVTNSATAVTNGLFTTTVDFGPGVFTGGSNWLQIAVRTNGGGSFTNLAPRQQLTPTPYAIQAGSANSASNLLGTLPVAQLSGTVPVSQLPGAVVTNNETGLNLSGAFSGSYSGNGGGMTNVNAATLAIPPGMALIPAGAFTMGNSIGDGDITDANPTNITVSAFYMDVNLVGWSQWQSVYFWATNHGYGFVDTGLGKAANHPVHTVDWYDAVKWCNARSQQAGLTPVYYTDTGLTQVYTNGEVAITNVNWSANGYRLPTEAEWEKAARGGLSGQRFPWGNFINANLANYYGITSAYDFGPNGYNITFATGALPYTNPVGYFAPNDYGFNDMAGNVSEWCWDWYATPYGQPTTTNPTGPATGSNRVLRGGYWENAASNARCAARTGSTPPSSASNYIGFRCVRGL